MESEPYRHQTRWGHRTLRARRIRPYVALAPRLQLCADHRRQRGLCQGTSVYQTCWSSSPVGTDASKPAMGARTVVIQRIGCCLRFRPHQFLVVTRIQWRTQVEALVLVASVALQKLHLLAGLHALGNDLQPQTVRKTDDALHDGGGFRARFEVLDEAAVDFQLVEREAVQTADR